MTLPRRETLEFLVSLLAPAVVIFLAVPAPYFNHFKAAAAPPGDSPIAWVAFQDPMEKAFSLEVPKGWLVKGGLFRLGYSDERAMVDLSSPDGEISIRFGDVSVPVYTLPSQFHNKEGEIYDLGAQAQLVVEHYRTGPDFAVLYFESRFANLCPSAKPDTQDVSFTAPDFVPLDAATSESSSGQMAFRCDTSAGPRIAYAYTKTARAGNLWQAPTIVSYLAAPPRVSLVQDIIVRAAKSFHLNPEWVEYQKRMDAEGLQYQRARQQQRMNEFQAQVRQFESRMRAMQSQVNAFERRQQAQASQVEGFTDVLNGLTPTTDPLTGENRKVWTGPKSNYWENGLGQVVNSTNSPGPGWRQLQVN
jgi:hypothetical protein